MNLSRGENSNIQENENILLVKAEAALASGDLHLAADACKALLVHFPESAHGYHLTASLFQATGNYHKARDYSATAAKLDHYVVRYHLQEGQILFILKNYAEAKNAFERAAKLDSAKAESYLWLGKTLVEQALFAEAIECFSKARLIDDKFDTRIEESWCYVQSGDCEAAKRYLFDILSENSKNNKAAAAYEMLAKISLYERNFIQAESLFKKAVAIDNSRAQAYFYLSLFCAGDNQEKEALDYLLKALNLDPTHLGSLLLLGNLFLQSGDFAAGEKAFSHVLALCPNHVLAWYGLLELWKSAGLMRENMKIMNEALSVMNDASSIKYLRSLFNDNVPAFTPCNFIADFYGAFADMLAPWIIATSVTEHLCELIRVIRSLPQLENKKYISLLDLGCGTGVVAEFLSDIIGISVGVDITPQMIAMAGRRKLYDALYEMDIVEYAMTSEASFDVVISVGALRWIGNLQPLFNAARAVMKPDGIFAFVLDKEYSMLAYSVSNHGRYSHNETYIHDIAQSEGLQIIYHSELQNGLPPAKHLFILKKTTIH